MRYLYALLLLIVPATAATAANTLIVEEIIAKVNGDIILRSDYDKFVDELRSEVERTPDATPEQKQTQLAKREKNVLRDLVDERLLVQKGKELGINVEGQVLRQRDDIMKRNELETVDEFEQWVSERTGMLAEDMMERMRENALSQSVLGQEVGSRIVVRREEVEEYYQEHKDEFVRSEGVRLAEILISREAGRTDEEFDKEAREVHARVDRGEPFGEMASRFSDSEGSKENGGDIGIWRRGSLQKEIEDLVFGKNPGHVTELIDVQRGKLILKVIDRYREGLAELEEVEEQIRNQLTAPRYSPAIREYLTELRTRSYIEIRPGFVDAAAAAGQDTSWSDPAKLAPVTTTRDEVLRKGKKRKLLWVIPLGGGDKAKKAEKKAAKKAAKEEEKEEKEEKNQKKSEASE